MIIALLVSDVTLKGSHRKEDGQILLKISVLHSSITTYQMNLISARSASRWTVPLKTDSKNEKVRWGSNMLAAPDQCAARGGERGGRHRDAQGAGQHITE